MADLNETSLENALQSTRISTFVDDRNMILAMRGTKLIVPPQLQFVADRLLETPGRVGTADNDINAIRNMGLLPEGYAVNHFTDPWILMHSLSTDCPDGFKHFERTPITTSMEGDLRYW